jgi:hypothetical protein
MEKPTYEYRADGLWLRIDSRHGTPAAVHTELLEAVTAILAEITDGESHRSGFLVPLYAILDALRPTAEHLAAGWDAEAAKRLEQPQEEEGGENE